MGIGFTPFISSGFYKYRKFNRRRWKKSVFQFDGVWKHLVQDVEEVLYGWADWVESGLLRVSTPVLADDCSLRGIFVGEY